MKKAKKRISSSKTIQTELHQNKLFAGAVYTRYLKTNSSMYSFPQGNLNALNLHPIIRKISPKHIKYYAEAATAVSSVRLYRLGFLVNSKNTHDLINFSFVSVQYNWFKRINNEVIYNPCQNSCRSNIK